MGIGFSKQNKITLSAKTLTGVFAMLLFISCKQTGVQGGNIQSAFKGVDSAEAVSPTAVQLNWELRSQFNIYKIYNRDLNDAIGTESFSKFTVKNLTQGRNYSFAVTGVDTATGKEIGLDNFVTVRTLNKFDGITTANLTTKSSTRIDLTWAMESKTVTYKIFAKEQSGAWNFTSPIASVNGTNTYSATNLKSGTTYCFYIVASYLDGTSEPATSPIGTVDSSAPCVATNTELSGIPVVNVNSVVPGEYPWFMTSGGNPDYVTDIFDATTNLRLASRTGNGTFRAFDPVTPGNHKYYAVVKAPNGGQAIVNLALNGEARDSVLMRSLRSTGSQGAIYPALISNGQGVQNLGQKIVRGDFNCDGYQDIAVSAPNATAYSTQRHYQQTGAVVVYYGYLPAATTDQNGNPYQPPAQLKTDLAPTISATAPNAQLIYYPVSGDYFRLGTQLATGNANGDCYRRGPTNLGGTCDEIYASGGTTDTTKVYTCDDLAISSATGDVFVMYGNPLSGLVTGAGATNYGQDELTCDSNSSTCRPVRLRATASSNSFGARAMVFGDYNNDGFDELVVSGRLDSNTAQANVYTLRGSRQGLHPLTTSATSYRIPLLFQNQSSGPALSMGAGDIGFGNALGTAFNSRNCRKADSYRSTGPTLSKYYDFEKCDDLVIGAPLMGAGRGSIVTCKAQVATGNSSDPAQITGWLCAQHYPDELSTDTAANYGASILGVTNGNGYPTGLNVLGANTAELAGAVFVGAPNATVSSLANAGKVYAYYITPESQSMNDGGIQGILGTSAINHVVNADNSIACNATNNNVARTSGLSTLRSCEHQVLYNSPAQANARFGATLGRVANLADPANPMRYLAVAAPNRSILSSDGKRTISGAGAVYLYKPDASVFGKETVASVLVQIADTFYGAGALGSAGCPTNGCTWYSGGVSPFGPSIIYPNDMNSGANFGAGGIVGGDFNGDNRGDVIAAAGNLSSPVEQNGGVFAFFSDGTFASSETNVGETISTNVSLELNYRFEQAKIIGDVNSDGYDDVVAHIITGTKVQTILFYGSSNGLVTSPAPSETPVGLGPLIISSPSDRRLGASYFRIGSSNGDAFDDILMFGSTGSYVYFGSFAGLVAGSEPQFSPIGKNPLRFAVGTSVNDLNFHTTATSLQAAVNPDSSYDTSLQGVGYGDFNGDGYDDFALGMNANWVLPDGIPSGMSYAGTNEGRVVVIYGSSIGPQTDRTNGRIIFKSGTTRAVRTNSAIFDVAAENPCSGGANPTCSVQMIASNAPAMAGAYNGVKFGFATVGLTSLEEASGEQYDELLVSDYRVTTSVDGGATAAAANTGAVYLYKGASTGLSAKPLQTLVPRIAGSQFGYSVAPAGDVNKDTYSDVAITAIGTANSGGYLYVFYSGNVNGQSGFFGPTNVSTPDYWAAPRAPIDINAYHVDANTPKPQSIQPLDSYMNTDRFGYGVAGIGDFNRDGYNDVAVNVPHGDYRIDSTKYDTGYVVIFFGSNRGLRADQTPSHTPRCYGGATPVCDPYQVFLPNREEYEYTYLTDSSVGDINGDGITDLMIGGFGRSHPSGKAFSTGVIYVMY